MYFLGILLAYLSGIVFPGRFFYMFVVGFLPSLAQLLLMFFTQSEPALYYAKVGRMRNADSLLRVFFNNNNEQA